VKYRFQQLSLFILPNFLKNLFLDADKTNWLLINYLMPFNSPGIKH